MTGELKAKLVLVGDAGVGKTCIVNIIKGNQFHPCAHTVSNENSIINIKVDGTNVQLNIYDTAGQERYQALSSQYARNADITFLVFDLSDENTLINIKYWLEVMVDVEADNIIYMVGSKRDLSSRIVTYDNARSFIDSLNFRKKIKYCEVSGKTGENINILFQSAATDFLQYCKLTNNNEFNSSIYISSSTSDSSNKCACKK